MEKELKDKWIAALRSGEYNQGKYALYNEETNTYCCLGVLCRLTNRDIIPTSNDNTITSNNSLYKDIQDNLVTNYKVYKEVMMLNDGNKTFNEIADYIEENL